MGFAFARTHAWMLARDTMSNNLFRQEVVTARRADWLGRVHFQAPRFGFYFSCAGLAGIVAILLALYACHYTRRERISGVLRAENGVLDLNAPRPGTITRVLVKDGERVLVGQPLVEISGELDSVKFGRAYDSINRELRSKRDRLKQDIVQQDQILEARERTLARRIELVAQQVASATAQIAIQQDRVQAQSELLERWMTFKDTGVVSRAQLLQSRDSLLQQQGFLEELKRSRSSLLEQKSDLDDQLHRAPFEAGTRKNELARQISDVSQAISENEALRGGVLRAQQSGVITNLLVHPGEQVVAEERLMTLVPDNTTLIAELWAPTRAIGFIAVGGNVAIRYAAYPYQKFGVYGGKVTEVSRSGLPIAAKEEPQENYYRVLVRLDRQNVTAYGKSEQLKPGMQLEADIAVERRRLIEWVFEPLYGLGRSTPRESVVGREHGS